MATKKQLIIVGVSTEDAYYNDEDRLKGLSLSVVDARVYKEEETNRIVVSRGIVLIPDHPKDYGSMFIYKVYCKYMTDYQLAKYKAKLLKESK